MSKLYEPSLPKLMEAIATEAKGMTRWIAVNFLKANRGNNGLVERANHSNQRIRKPSTKPSGVLEGNWVGELLPSPTRRPFRFEDLQRRTVPWLTVDATSSISMTPYRTSMGLLRAGWYSRDIMVGSRT